MTCLGRVLVVPFLPESWQRRLGLRQWGFPPPRLLEPEAEDSAEQQDAAVPEDPAEPDDAVAPVENGPVADEVPAIAEPAPEDEGAPAEWSWRFEMLAKKAVGNAARCYVSLGAASLGASPSLPGLHKFHALLPVEKSFFSVQMLLNPCWLDMSFSFSL